MINDGNNDKQNDDKDNNNNKMEMISPGDPN